MINFRKFIKGLQIKPKTSTESDSQGDMEVLSSDGKLKYHNGTSNSSVVTEAHSATLTNKTIDADSNTISNIDNADIKSGAAIDRSKLASGSNNRVVVNNGSGVLSDAAAITANRALASDANGIPVHSSVTDTELGYVSGVTSAIQTQLNDKALASDLSTHISDTSTHGVSGDILGTTDSQVITNKDIDGGTASNSRRVTVPKDTTSNLAALTRKEATVVYDTTKDTLAYDDGSNIVDLVKGGSSPAASGEPIFIDKNNGDLRFKKLVAGSNITLTPSSDSITVASSSGPSSQSKTIIETFTEFVATLTAGENITAQDAVALDISSGIYRIFKADTSTSNRELGFIGFATATATSGNTVTVHCVGPMSGFSGLTVGQRYYVSLTGSISTSAGPNSVFAGQALDSTVLWVDSLRNGSRFPSAVQYFLRSHGNLGTIGSPTATNKVDHFNMTSWSAGTDDTNSHYNMHTSTASIMGQHLAVDGILLNTGGATLMTRLYNLSSWSSASGNRTTAKASQGVGLLGGNIYYGKGSTDNTITGTTNTLDSFNGSTWTNAITTFPNSRQSPISFVQGSLVHWIGGTTSGGGGANDHDTYNGASLGTQTVLPVSITTSTIGGAAPGASGIGGHYNSTDTYKWDGASWSSAITCTYNANSTGNASNLGAACGQNISTQSLYINGGVDGGSNSLTTSAVFNGTSWSAGTASTNAVAGGQGGNI